MKIGRLSLVALAMLACTHVSLAKTRELPPSEATPVGSPGDWLSPDDYPAVALRYSMVGKTAFKLTVDTTGKPSRCDIVESSGFDVLDRATCERLMANAKFSPAHNRAAKVVESSFSSRVRWVLPNGMKPTLGETFGFASLTVDQTGKVTSCRMVIHVPAVGAALSEKPCGRGIEPPPAFILELLGNHQGPSTEIELQQADVFTPELRARVLAPKPGYEQRGLNVYHFTVTKDGKIGQCSYAEQRGIDHFATDYCGQAHNNSYDPPFSAFGKDGVANGWHIARALLKTGG
jgi:TonB family protein